MKLLEIVIDTNVLVSGLRSKDGYAFQFLEMVGTDRFYINLSVPLILEYEDVLLRQQSDLAVSRSAIEAILDFHCRVAKRHKIYFLWRPFLRDPKDDMVLELAVRAQCTHIITYNKRDFAGVEQFGLSVATPSEFLALIGAKRS